MSRTPAKPAPDLMELAHDRSGAVIGARLRRLSERIDRDAERLHAESGVAFEQRWMAPLRLLAQHGPLSVSEIATAIGITHVSVSQARQSLAKAGLISWTADPEDGRSRKLHLTPAGRKLVAKLASLWRSLIAAGQQLDEETGGTVAALERLDRALDRSSLYERTTAHLRSSQAATRSRGIAARGSRR